MYELANFNLCSNLWISKNLGFVFEETHGSFAVDETHLIKVDYIEISIFKFLYSANFCIWEFVKTDEALKDPTN